MAKKQKTFAEKAMGGKTGVAVCSKCEQPIESVMVVNTEKSSENNSWKFTKSMQKVCKCNENEVYA